MGWGQIPELYHLPGFHDPFSAFSHLFGAAVFLILGGLLLRRGRGNRTRLAFLGVYVASCVFLLSMSGVYHMMVRGGTARQVMARLDHSAIFVLIAGTFTPLHGLLFRGWLRWGPLAFVWACAITGICVKAIFFDDLVEWIGLTLYLTLGWFGAASGVLVARRYGVRFVRPLLYGGVAYTIGAVIEYLRWPVVVSGVIHPHDVFHLAVLTGALFHWLFVRQFAAGEFTRLERSHRCG